MPAWAQFVLAVSTVFVALAALWTKVLRPGMRAASAAEEMLPLLKEMTKVFRDSPDAFGVLHDIAAQFHSDGGASLRDVVNRLEASAIANHQAGEALKVGVESSRILAERDRQQLDRLIILLDRLTIRVDAVAASGARIELDRVAVAHDLDASRHRADTAEEDTGAAADAASRTAPEEAP